MTGLLSNGKALSKLYIIKDKFTIKIGIRCVSCFIYDRVLSRIIEK